MKVIKNRATQWSKRIDCVGCKSTLEIEADDVYTTQWGSGMDADGYETVYRVKCPCCETATNLKDIPVFVIALADCKAQSNRRGTK